MSAADPYAFDIDVDISPLLGDVDEPTLINSKWYELVAGQPDRIRSLQGKVEEVFRKELLYAQWRATARRRLDRRRAVRVPILSRVHVDGGRSMVATDLSLSGMRASGVPAAPVMDIEFNLPGLQFPIDAKAEVVEFRSSNVIPLVGMRFAWIDRPYVDLIASYVARRREKTPRRLAA
jgi:hypothetical protein